MKIYKQNELPELQPIINNARQLWREECEIAGAKYGDVGTCVIGAGFEVPVIPKGYRKSRMVTILSPREVCRYQGSIIWEHSMDKIRSFLKSQGIEAHYNWGRMD